MKKNTLIIIGIILIVVALGGGFFAGVQYQKTQRGSFANGQFRMNGQAGNFQRSGQGGSFQGTRPVSGEIVSADDKSVTVKLLDGSTKIVILSGNTLINKAATGTKADLVKGAKVAAFGTANSDGSITAQSIQLNPTGRMMGGSPR